MNSDDLDAGVLALLAPGRQRSSDVYRFLEASGATNREVFNAVRRLAHNRRILPKGKGPNASLGLLLEAERRTSIEEDVGANVHVAPGQPMCRSHMFVPDSQHGPGRPTAHLDWIGQYIVERKPDCVIHAGDLGDFTSLSSYEGKGSRKMEGARYAADVAAYHDAARRLREPALRANLATEFHLLDGNHEDRIPRALDADPKLEGTIGLDDLAVPNWIKHKFLEMVWLDGVCYSHYFYHPMTGRPWTGTIDNRLKQIGHSFTMGHQQVLLTGMRFVGGKQQRGLVAGACYLHDEDYKGPQGNAHWRGVICKHEVRDGQYDIMEVSLNYLCRRYEGCSLEHYKKVNKI